MRYMLKPLHSTNWDGSIYWVLGDFRREGPQSLERSDSDRPLTMHGQRLGHRRDINAAEGHFREMQKIPIECCNGTEQCYPSSGCSL